MTLARLLKNRKHDENVTHCISNHRVKPRPARFYPPLIRWIYLSTLALDRKLEFSPTPSSKNDDVRPAVIAP
jgi:hypothetical protein